MNAKTYNGKKKKVNKPKHEMVNRTRLMQDLGWAMARLDHLLFIYEHPETTQGQFGPHESMVQIHQDLPEIFERYGFKRAWREPR